MSLYTEPSLTGGMDESLVEIATTVTSLIPGLLMFVWGVVFLSGMATQKLRSGYADSPMWAVMASISTLLISLLMTIKPGLINLETLSIVIALNVFAGLWLFLSRGRGEY